MSLVGALDISSIDRPKVLCSRGRVPAASFSSSAAAARSARDGAAALLRQQPRQPAAQAACSLESIEPAPGALSALELTSQDPQKMRLEKREFTILYSGFRDVS